MNINNAFPSTYLKAADLQGKSVNIAIERVQFEELGGEHKLIVYFIGSDRGLVLNKTNANIIAEMHGPETDDWHGKKITLYPARVEFQGKIVDAIRVKLAQADRPAAVSQAPLNKPAPPPARSNGATNGFGNAPDPPPHTSIEDDRIPF